MQWHRGIAFIRGINICGRNPIDRREMLRVCRSIEDDNVRVLGLFKLDNVIFEKKGIHYASVGSRLEKVLSRHFKHQIYVTVRSMRTLKGCVQ